MQLNTTNLTSAANMLSLGFEYTETPKGLQTPINSIVLISLIIIKNQQLHHNSSKIDNFTSHFLILVLFMNNIS